MTSLVENAFVVKSSLGLSLESRDILESQSGTRSRIRAKSSLGVESLSLVSVSSVSALYNVHGI